MKRQLLKLNFSFAFLLLLAIPAHAKLKVGTSIQDLESIVKMVGGTNLETFSIAKGTQDPHQIEAKPSFMVKVRDADLFVSIGLELESAWLNPLIQGSRNPNLVRGAKGNLEVGPSIEPIEVVTGAASRAEGDVHPEGNPHFELDPVRLAKAAQLIAGRLGELDPAHKDEYTKNADAFQKRMMDKLNEWKARIAKTGVSQFVSYHKTFSYFASRFGLKNDLFLEPKPGIPPTASHILQIINEMKSRKVNLVLIENFFDDSVKSRLQQQIPNVKIYRLPVYVGGEPNVETSEQLIEKIVQAIESSAK